MKLKIEDKVCALNNFKQKKSERDFRKLLPSTHNHTKPRHQNQRKVPLTTQQRRVLSRAQLHKLVSVNSGNTAILNDPRNLWARSQQQ